VDAFEQSATWLSQGIARHLSTELDSHPRRSFRKLKAICELSFLEFLGSSAPHPLLRAALDPVLSRLGASRELVFLYACNLDHANLFLPLFVVLAETGRLATQHALDCDTLARRSILSSKERLPFRWADLLHAISWWEGDPAWHDRCVDALSVGCLRPGANLLRVSTSDDYSVTHAIFYGTDFGRRRWPSSLAEPLQIEAILHGLEIDALADRNWDILAEVALAYGYLGQRDDRQRLFQILVAQQANDGSWESPASMDAVLARDGFETTEHRFFERYHTTLLCLMAGSEQQIHRETEARPQRRQVSSGSSARSWDERIASLGQRASTPAAHLLRGYHRLARGERIDADEIPSSVFTDPIWLQPALDLVLCAKWGGADVTAWTDTAQAIVEDPRVASSRAMRTMRARATAACISGDELEYDADLCRAIREQLVAPPLRRDPFSQELIDSLAYLSITGTRYLASVELGELRVLLRDTATLALRRRAWDGLLIVMGLAGQLLIADAAAHEEWTEILDHLWSETFGPGWCGLGGSDGDIRRESLWCQASQSAVALCRTNPANPPHLQTDDR